jgi:four helix bundle protein
VNSSTVVTYRDLGVWQQAMSLAAECYRVTKSFPRSEVYGITSQIRREATSVPANIAEGNGRETTGSYIQFLRISQGSLKELETLLLLANSVELLDTVTSERMVGSGENVGKPLRALIRVLQAKEASERKGQQA